MPEFNINDAVLPLVGRVRVFGKRIGSHWRSGVVTISRSASSAMHMLQRHNIQPRSDTIALKDLVGVFDGVLQRPATLSNFPECDCATAPWRPFAQIVFSRRA